MAADLRQSMQFQRATERDAGSLVCLNQQFHQELVLQLEESATRAPAPTDSEIKPVLSSPNKIVLLLWQRNYSTAPNEAKRRPVSDLPAGFAIVDRKRGTQAFLAGLFVRR